MSVVSIAALITEFSALIGTVIPIAVWLKRVADGSRCQLRSEMLRIYYHNREVGEIRQYEYENFVYLYEAYKALRGNSFIDKIYKEVQSWEIIT